MHQVRSPRNVRRLLFAPLCGLSIAMLLSVSAGSQQPRPNDCVVHDDLRYSEAAREPRRNRLDLYVPAAADSLPPVVLFLHGGTWTGGDKEGFANMGRTLAAQGIACAVANMRLFPFGKPEQMVDDGAQALAFVHAHASDFGVDGSRLFVMGHSSGAHLSACVAFDSERLAALGVPVAALRGTILLSGVYDVRSRHPALDSVFRGSSAYKRSLSPALLVDRGDPSVLLVAAEQDLAGLSLSARALRDRLWASEVSCEVHALAARNHADYVVDLMAGHGELLQPIVRFVLANGAPETNAVRRPPASVLWLVDDAAQQTVAEQAAAALASAGVTVCVELLADACGERAAALFRAEQQRARACGEPPPDYLFGLGQCADAVLAASLDREHDGLLGRLVVGAEQEIGGRVLQSLTRGDEPTALLALLGDRDPAVVRQHGVHLAIALQQRRVAADAIELPGLTAVEALAQMTEADDLLLPLLLAFLRPMGLGIDAAQAIR